MQVALSGNDQRIRSCGDSNLTANSYNYEPSTGQVDQRQESWGIGEPNQFSFAQKPKENFKIHDIKSYIKHFERDVKRDMVNGNADGKGSDYYTDEFDLHGRLERLLFDRVFSRNRIESGGLHLCAGNFAVSLSPFGFVI